MNTHIALRRRLVIGVAAALAVGAAGCSDDSPTAGAPSEAIEAATADAGSTQLADSHAATAASATATADQKTDATLSDDEVAGLLWIREEEQLAHDVYLALHEQWGLRIFENIGSSESTHVESTLRVLDTYGIADPAAGNETGQFTDPRIQVLYDRLVEQGRASLEDALEVGAFIEELDIDDLRIRSAATDVSELIDLYAKLEQGSRNHLRAFTSQLELRGGEYEPTQLAPDAYDEIISSPTERGHGG